MQRTIATARMCVREQGYFGLAELVGGYLLRVLNLLALLAIWRALLAQGADMEGLTRDQALTYTLLSAVLHPMLNIATPASGWMHDGTMLGLYQRPASIFGQLAAHTVGGWVTQLLLFSFPVTAIAAMAGIRVIPASGWFLLSLPLAVSQGFAVDFLFTCALIRLKSQEWTMHRIRAALSALLTGAVIPFRALPWGLGDWLALSPFGTLAGAPLALYAGLDSAGRLLAAQVFWNIILWPLALVWFKRSRERMVSYGG
ncbi:MAG: ABC-2 family transporter protein [Firmicutes bacterium]|nr:ABC-2 family transporter protein [Bacillota bacterium]